MKPDSNPSRQAVSHVFPPVFDKHSKVLILGTMPSPKSREAGSYYGHPQNRMWKVLSTLLDDQTPSTLEEKQAFLRLHGIAMWDVLHSCEIIKASDNSIRVPVPNDLTPIFRSASIQAVFTTGRKATQLYEKYILGKQSDLPPNYLPSTSPANCRIPLAELMESYRVILRYL